MLKHQKLCILDVFKAWDYARTISRSKKLHIACLKTDIGTKKYIFFIFEHFVCMLCVYFMSVVGTCSLCMYSRHVCSL